MCTKLIPAWLFALFPHFCRGVTVLQVSNYTPVLCPVWMLMSAMQCHMPYANTPAWTPAGPTPVIATLASTWSRITKAARPKVLYRRSRHGLCLLKQISSHVLYVMWMQRFLAVDCEILDVGAHTEKVLKVVPVLSYIALHTTIKLSKCW